MTELNFYPQTRAIEDAIANPGVRPLRIVPITWPLWEVEIEADIHEEQNYAIVESFVLRCVADAGFESVDEIADFLGIRTELARRCIRYLMRIRHLADVDGRLRLTELGAKSLKTGVRLVPKRHLQSVLIDRFEGRPLPTRFYHNAIDVCATPDVRSAEARFRPVFSPTAFTPGIIDELADRADRADFGVPRYLFNVKITAQRDAFMPVYLITTVDSGLLVYGPTSTSRDAFLEAVCRRQEILQALTATEDDTDLPQLWTDLIASRDGLRGIAVQRDDGLWRLTMSPGSFGPDKPFKPARIGTFVVHRGHFIQLWCDDEQLRNQAAKDRILNAPMLPGIRNRVNLNTHAASICRQLLVDTPDIEDLRRHAAETGDEWKVERIENLPG